jgi:phage baseplate assembly protein W
MVAVLMTTIDQKQSHFDYPFSFDVNGHVRVVDQDSEDDIMNCVIAIVKTPLGFRLEAPDFGINEVVFQEGDIDIEDIRAALDLWEERGIYTVLDNPVLLDELARTVQIQVEVRND